jgi:hypothetical protein
MRSLRAATFALFVRLAMAGRVRRRRRRWYGVDLLRRARPGLRPPAAPPPRRGPEGAPEDVDRGEEQVGTDGVRVDHALEGEALVDGVDHAGEVVEGKRRGGVVDRQERLDPG